MKCLDILALLSSELEQFAAEIKELTKNIQLIFYAHGVVIPIIVGVGVFFNVLGLVVLCREQFRMSPYSILQGLCLCDICILAFSIYSDTVPALRAKRQLQKFESEFLPKCEMVVYSLASERTLINNLRRNSLLDEIGEYVNDSKTTESNDSKTFVDGRSKSEKSDKETVIFVNLTNSESVADTNTMLMLLLLRELQVEASTESDTSMNDWKGRNDTTDRTAGFVGSLGIMANGINLDWGAGDRVKNSPSNHGDIQLPHDDDRLLRLISGSESKSCAGLHCNKSQVGGRNTTTPADTYPYQSKSDVAESSSNSSWELNQDHLINQRPSLIAQGPVNVARKALSNNHDITTITAPVVVSKSKHQDAPSAVATGSALASSSTSNKSQSGKPVLSAASNPFPGDTEINSKPIAQATERWLSYNFMTFNLGLTLTLAAERCIAVAFPFRARSWFTLRRSRLSVLTLLVLTLLLHTPQYIKEVVLAINSPDRLKDDFRGRMLQAFRIDYERVVVYLISVIIILLVAMNLVLMWLLRRYKSKVKDLSHLQLGSLGRVDINVTVAVISIVFLQLPHSVAINVLASMTLEGFTSNVTSFTRAVVIIRVLYVTSSAVHCLTYCFLSRRFRDQFRKMFCSFSLLTCGRHGDKVYARDSPRRRKWPCCSCTMPASCCGRRFGARSHDAEGRGSDSSCARVATTPPLTSMTSLSKSQTSLQSSKIATVDRRVSGQCLLDLKIDKPS